MKKKVNGEQVDMTAEEVAEYNLKQQQAQEERIKKLREQKIKELEKNHNSYIDRELKKLIPNNKEDELENKRQLLNNYITEEDIESIDTNFDI